MARRITLPTLENEQIVPSLSQHLNWWGQGNFYLITGSHSPWDCCACSQRYLKSLHSAPEPPAELMGPGPVQEGQFYPPISGLGIIALMGTSLTNREVKEEVIHRWRPKKPGTFCISDDLGIQAPGGSIGNQWRCTDTWRLLMSKLGGSFIHFNIFMTLCMDLIWLISGEQLPKWLGKDSIGKPRVSNVKSKLVVTSPIFLSWQIFLKWNVQWWSIEVPTDLY